MSSDASAASEQHGGSGGRSLTAQEEAARQQAQRAEEDEHKQHKEQQEHEQRSITASLLSRALHFSRAPPPSDGSDAHPHRLPVVMFFSSTNSIVPHMAAALINARQAEKLRARWTTSHPEGALLDSKASDVMREYDVDESDDLMTPFSSPQVQADITHVVTLDALAHESAAAVFPGKTVINHELANPQTLSAAAAGEGAAHQQVVYRQSCNAIEAFVNDLPDIIAHLA